MKPGCFLKSIIVLTILVAVILYIFQHKSRLFLEPGKKIVADLFINNWDDEFSYVKNTPEKTELKESLVSYIKNLKYEDIQEDNDLDKLFAMVNGAAKDSVITGGELKEILNNLKMKNKNERPE
jgi:hypothetical protein